MSQAHCLFSIKLPHNVPSAPLSFSPSFLSHFVVRAGFDLQLHNLLVLQCRHLHSFTRHEHFYDTVLQLQTNTLVIMKYFAALPFAASLVAAQGDMQIMSLSPAPAGAVTHTVSPQYDAQRALVNMFRSSLVVSSPSRLAWHPS